MLIKTNRYGKGPASEAIGYATRQGKHKPHDGETVEHIRGNTAMFVKVADDLDFVHKYTSAAIAFHPDDMPTPAELQAVMDDYEKACFGDADPARFAQTFIAHKKESGIHIHVFTARVDMQTGLSFNPCPPGWQKTFDPMVEKHNYKAGWVRPDDPLHARNTRTDGHTHFVDAKAVRDGLASKNRTNAKAMIDDFITSRVSNGLVIDRADVLESLGEIGEIKRSGKDFITLQVSDKKYRMKGDYYGAGFNAAATKNKQTDRERQSRADRIDEAKSSLASRGFEEATQKKSEFIKFKYKGSRRDRKATPNAVISQNAGSGGSRIGNNAVGVYVPTASAKFAPRLHDNTTQGQDLHAVQNVGEPQQQPEKRSDIFNKIEVIYGRIKQSIDSVIERTKQLAGEVGGGAGNQGKSLERASASIEQASASIEQAIAGNQRILEKDRGISLLEKAGQGIADREPNQDQDQGGMGLG